MCYLKFVFVIFMAVHVTSEKDKGYEATGRIFGGTNFKITDAPYMALVCWSSDNDCFCGASVIHQKFLVSAAHCFTAGTQYYIKVGTDKIKGGDRHEIEKITIHPNYEKNGYDNDVAVIKLKKKLKFSDRVRPIALAPKNLVLQPGEMLETMGFGATETSSSWPVLLKVEVPYVDIRECSKILKLSLTPSMMCAGGVEGEDACKGDSGGPLVYNDMLVGIVSFGRGCGKAPGVYARVSHTRDFIDKTIARRSWINWPWSWFRL